MKNEEDEAFDDLAKKQGAWGGGFKAKQAMAADKLQEHEALKLLEEALRSCNNIDEQRALDALMRDAQPAQKPVCDKDPQGCWNVRCQLGKQCKNLAQPAQERNFCSRCGKRTADLTAIHTCTPPQREWVGLTPEDILDLFDEQNLYGSKLVKFTRAVETKIKDKNNGA